VAERWHTFPAQMGEHRAFITFDESYAREAPKDARSVLVKVRAVIKKPNASGMPTDQEFPELRALDANLETSFNSNGGRFVGNVTVNGRRYFYYYVSCTENDAAELIQRTSRETGYDLAYVYEEDSAKQGYFNDLYPTPDDWQMIKDLQVLDVLRERGDATQKPREISHWAYFADPEQARRFADWAKANNYNVGDIEPLETSGKTTVRLSHVGTVVLEDITRHTIGLNRKARELNGDYDGWETSIES